MACFHCPVVTFAEVMDGFGFFFFFLGGKMQRSIKGCGFSDAKKDVDTIFPHKPRCCLKRQ